IACGEGACILKQRHVRVRTATEMPAIATAPLGRSGPAAASAPHQDIATAPSASTTVPMDALAEANPRAAGPSTAPTVPAIAPTKRPTRTARHQGRHRDDLESGHPWRDERVLALDGRHLGYSDGRSRAIFPMMFMGWPH